MILKMSSQLVDVIIVELVSVEDLIIVVLDVIHVELAVDVITVEVGVDVIPVELVVDVILVVLVVALAAELILVG
jgi:hypothetical protein